MLSSVINCIRSSSSPWTTAPLVRVALAALASHARSGAASLLQQRSVGSCSSASGSSGSSTKWDTSTSLQAIMARGVPVSVLEFEVSPAEAVKRFNDYQRTACMGFHAPSLLHLLKLQLTNEPPAIAKPPAAAASGSSTARPAWTGPGTRSGTGADQGAQDGGSSSSGGKEPTSLTAAYLPFWCFELEYSSEARAQLGFKDQSTKETVWRPMADPRIISTRAKVSYDDPVVQIYASYKHTRDVGGGAAGPGLPGRARPLRPEEAVAGAVGGVGLQLGAGGVGGGLMRQGVAWALAARAVAAREVAAAAAAVKADTRASDVKDVHITLQFHRRFARLVLLPAYIARYVYGTRYKAGTSGVILPQVFVAAVGGTRDGRVVAPQHVSPAKASLGGGGLAGGLGLLATDPGVGGLGLAGLVGLESFVPYIGAVEAVTLAALAASGAGMWAHKRPQTLRSHHAAQQVRADYEFYRQYDRHEVYGSGLEGGGTAGEAGGAAGEGGRNEDLMLWLWADADWRRWEHEEPWSWDEAERRKWAEDLWRRQSVRRLERQRYVARRLAEDEADAARERAGGRRGAAGAQHHRPRDHGMGYDSTADDDGRYDSGGRRRRSDFMGYYRVLGLQDAEAVSTDDVKAAFKAQALQLHPDRVAASGSEQEVREAAVRFQKLQIAYDTLKDTEKRRLYDRGQLVS